MEGQIPQNKNVAAQELGAKYGSKREVYRLLTSDTGLYLSSYETMTTCWNLRDLMAGKRTKIKANAIKHINVPQFEGLTIETMLKLASRSPAVMRALPTEEKERNKLPRQYIANVIFTVLGDEFEEWVN